jgi:hypothetical protein
VRCERSRFNNRFLDPPYFNSNCVNCGVALEHTGASSGITWIEVGTKALKPCGMWECGPCPDCPGAVYHQHVPVDVVSKSEVDAAIESVRDAEAPPGT